MVRLVGSGRVLEPPKGEVHVVGRVVEESEDRVQYEMHEDGQRVHTRHPRHELERDIQTREPADLLDGVLVAGVRITSFRQVLAVVVLVHVRVAPGPVHQ